MLKTLYSRILAKFPHFHLENKLRVISMDLSLHSGLKKTQKILPSSPEPFPRSVSKTEDFDWMKWRIQFEISTILIHTIISQFLETSKSTRLSFFIFLHDISGFLHLPLNLALSIQIREGVFYLSRNWHEMSQKKKSPKLVN